MTLLYIKHRFLPQSQMCHNIAKAAQHSPIGNGMRYPLTSDRQLYQVRHQLFQKRFQSLGTIFKYVYPNLV